MGIRSLWCGLAVGLLLAGGSARDTAWAGELGRSPLHVASRAGDAAQVKALLAAGGDVKARDAYGYTPLHLAAWSGDRETILLLLEAGAEVQAAALNKYTPLHLAAWSGSGEAVKALLGRGANVHAEDYDFRTALHYAASRAATVALLEAGAEANHRWLPWTRTPLLDAAMHGFPDVIEALLEAGAILQSTDSSHFTPLHWAAWGGHPAAVKLLLAKGADAYYQDDSGYTPLFWAEYWKHAEVVQLLKEHMARTPCTADPQRE